LACGEHLFFHGASPNSIVALAVAAGATQSIRLLSSIALAAVSAALFLSSSVFSTAHPWTPPGLGSAPAVESAGSRPSAWILHPLRPSEVADGHGRLFTGSRPHSRGRTPPRGQNLNPPPLQRPDRRFGWPEGAHAHSAGRPFADVWMRTRSHRIDLPWTRAINHAAGRAGRSQRDRRNLPLGMCRPGSTGRVAAKVTAVSACQQNFAPC
jgi:alkanesulfonate monooxygenase SsuD/methylene tetrahydromethanopterin reductase-like flavin-dependent oxidoreductase (luciferase family)